jgi:exodeoxyribonuclease V beta subunit
MLRNFLHRYGVVYRLLEYTDGERRVTNLRHLAERLHCDADKLGMGGLLAWFSAKRKAPGYANIEELLRLESDENLVKILTIHVAKGLEFPLVFCPFLWDGKLFSKDDEVLTFHDPETHAAVIDFGSETREQSREQAKAEERAENIRLLYVALTRAKYRCWMVWGKINEAETSAPAWLLHRGAPKKNAAAQVQALLEDASGVSLADMRVDLDRLQRSSNGAIAVVDFPSAAVSLAPAETSSPVLAARAFTGAIGDSKRVTSFTGLAHGRSLEAPDYDAADREAELEPIASGRDIFAFPRGAQAGKCLHAIFEHVDFTKLARPELELLVGKQLAAHGFESVWVQTIADMVERVAATALDEGGALRLDRVPLKKRLDELEFY